MKYPNLNYEKKCWQRGFEIVAGCDEVGRGSFAGPVVCGAVVFSPHINILTEIRKALVKIDDSKKLTNKQRREANDWIKEYSATWGIGSATVGEINKFGIMKATSSAFRRAVSDANQRSKRRVEYLLIDAFYIPYFGGYPTQGNKARQQPISGGDSKSVSIAASSIIAKVYRDDLMILLGEKEKYKKYAWRSNKGYGTRGHREAIINFGKSKHHRQKFIRNYILTKN